MPSRLTTSAPRSASSIAASGPDTICVASTTVNPASGPRPVDADMPGAYVLAWDGWRSVPYVVAMDITGASAIVTGGASGIGEACVRLLAKRGAKVVIVDMQDDKGKALATEVGGAFCHADVTNTDEVIAAVETAKEMGPLRVLVNSAGIGWASRTIGRDGAYDS